jgi:hypothetical protein
VPNLFAYCMILMWPLIAILFYKKFDTITATFWTVVGGYMFLPAKTVFDLPLLPDVGKDEIAALSALMGCVLIHKIKFHFFGKTQIHKLIFAIIIFIPFINMFFNQETMFNGLVWIQGLTIYDAISQVLSQYLVLLPFLIGLVVVQEKEDVVKTSTTYLDIRIFSSSV